MKALIVHLSDLHITSDDQVVCSRSLSIANAVKTLESRPDICIVVASGDIAFSGAEQEYYQALAFFDSLRDDLSRQSVEGEPNRRLPVEFVLAPGNHDCDFSAASSVRQAVVDTILSYPDKADDPAMTGVCTSVQRNFFELLHALGGPDLRSADGARRRLCWEYSFNHGEERLLFQCCNTAWLSQLHEQQGKLYFPPQLLAGAKADSCILVFHHTLNWLEIKNMRDFRARIDETANLILTGHDHDATWRSQTLPNRSGNLVLEGGALRYFDNSTKSDFNVLVIDTKDSRLKIGHFDWDSERGIYAPSGGSRLTPDRLAFEWLPTSMFARRSGHRFPLSTAFSSFLDDLGIAVNHPRRERATLRDLFVFPDLCEVRIPPNSIPRFVRGDDFLSLLDNEGVSLISGDHLSGKTALAKATFRALYDRECVPLLLDAGRPIRRGDQLTKYLSEKFTEQYGPDQIAEFQQLDRGQRAIIIDDYHKLRLPTPARRQFISDLSKFARKVILLADSLLVDLDDMLGPHVSAAGSLPNEHYEIQPFGYLARDLIIERWLTLGDSDSADAVDSAQKLATIRSTLDNVFGRNFVPAYPMFVLTVLQNVEAGQSMNTSAGAHGYFIELLVRTALFRGRNKEELDLAAGYLEYLAYRIFCLNRNRISSEELTQIHNDYRQRHAIARSQESIVGPLVQQQILTCSNDCVEFRYPYMLHYFVALFLRDNLEKLEVRQQISHLTESMHLERNSNILLFLAHLTHHSALIDELLRTAKRHYVGVAEATLAEDARFLIQLGVPQVSLALRDPQSERQQYLIAKDQEERALTPIESQDTFDGKDFEPVVELSGALRNLEVLGQVLKSFPGTLEAETKARIASECYSIGRRSLSAIFEMIKQNEQALLALIFDSLHGVHPDLPDRQAMEIARSTLMGLAYGIAFGVIKKVSQSVGCADNIPTYDRILRDDPAPMVNLIDTSIRLDQMSVVPLARIEEQANSFQSNPVALSLLRHLVVQHFRLFSVDYRTVQALCAKLEIPLKNVKALDPHNRIVKGT